jgi:AcrR family transcriptional regulator
LTTAWEVIVEWAGEDRPYAVLDLLSAVRCRLRRRLLGHRARGTRLVPVPDPDVLSPAAPGPGASGADELARAIDQLEGRGLDSADAAVLYAHRVLGYTLTELSALTGKSRRHLGDRRDRAVRALTA